MSNHENDRRRFNRVSFRSPARVKNHTTGGTIEAELVDISLKGVLLESSPEDQPGADSDVTVKIPLGESGSNQPTITLHGSVVHRETTTFGVRWSEIDSESMGHLHRLLELNLSPDEVRRELSELTFLNE